MKNKQPVIIFKTTTNALQGKNHQRRRSRR